MSPDIIKGNTVTITKLAQTYRAGKIPVRWLLQFSDATDCLDDNRKEDAVFYEVCVHRKHCSTFLYCSPYEACHRNSTWRRKVIKNFHRAFLFLVWLNQGLRFCEKTIFSFSQIIFDYRYRLQKIKSVTFSQKLSNFWMIKLTKTPILTNY